MPKTRPEKQRAKVAELALELLGRILTELNPKEFSREEIVAEFGTCLQLKDGLTERELDELLDFLLLGRCIIAQEERKGFFSITDEGEAFYMFTVPPEEETEETN